MQMRKSGLLALVLAAAVLLPSVSAAGSYGKKSSTAAAATAKSKPMDIVATAKSAGSFNTLVAALTATGLDKELQKKGPFTVFAPTDEAFAKLPEGTVEGLLKDKDKLTAILLHHVVSGSVKSGQVVQLDSATPLSGKSLAIDTQDGVRVGAAKVTTADVLASNGVIHIIDTVLIP